MTALFADSHYYIALANASDADHAKAAAFARTVSHPIVTTAWVITELADGMCKVGTRGTFDKLLGLIRTDAMTTIISADQLLMDRGLRLYAARPTRIGR